MWSEKGDFSKKEAYCRLPFTSCSSSRSWHQGALGLNFEERGERQRGAEEEGEKGGGEEEREGGAGQREGEDEGGEQASQVEEASDQAQRLT